MPEAPSATPEAPDATPEAPGVTPEAPDATLLFELKLALSSDSSFKISLEWVGVSEATKHHIRSWRATVWLTFLNNQFNTCNAWVLHAAFLNVFFIVFNNPSNECCCIMNCITGRFNDSKKELSFSVFGKIEETWLLDEQIVKHCNKFVKVGDDWQRKIECERSFEVARFLWIVLSLCFTLRPTETERWKFDREQLFFSSFAFSSNSFCPELKFDGRPLWIALISSSVKCSSASLWWYVECWIPSDSRHWKFVICNGNSCDCCNKLGYENAPLESLAGTIRSKNNAFSFINWCISIRFTGDWTFVLFAESNGNNFKSIFSFPFWFLFMFCFFSFKYLSLHLSHIKYQFELS